MLESKNSWINFREFIEVANNNCNWLVLRNFEYLPDDFFGNDKDVDVLCEDLEGFVKIMKLKKIPFSTSNYETVIDGKVVPFDIRFLGDGYYDKLWQYKMLTNKIYTNRFVPRMNDKDYFYGLIYHSKIQKYEVKELYKKRLFELAKSLKINSYQLNSIGDDKYLANLLSAFMNSNSYNYTSTVDISVPKNLKFFKLLDDAVKNRIKASKEILFISYMPSWLFILTPRFLKEIMKNSYYAVKKRRLK